MRKVLITGDTGFIGSNLKKYLLEREIPVQGFSLRDGFDILNPEQLLHAAEDCSLIYHIAAYANPAESVVNPDAAFKVNVQGTLNVLETCRKVGLPLIYPSTCEIYGDSVTPITEEYPLKPPNPYAASKAAADLICYTYFKCYGLDIKVLRLFNPYGPHQQLNKVLPTFYFQAKENNPLTIFSDGSDTRDYVHVDDIVRGLYLARDLPAGEAVNLATGVATTILEVARRVIELTGSRSTLSFVDYPGIFGGIRCQVGSGEKAKKLLDWEPGVPISGGIEKTLQWLESLNGLSQNV